MADHSALRYVKQLYIPQGYKYLMVLSCLFVQEVQLMSENQDLDPRKMESPRAASADSWTHLTPYVTDRRNSKQHRT
jgi:hypothetical protein